MNTGIWRDPPELTLEALIAFWGSQQNYDDAEMTNDNGEEMDIVLSRVRAIRCEDIVTLGGADGCRDPKLILEDMQSRRSALPSVIFNDLAKELVCKARDKHLTAFAERGVNIAYVPGTIADVCKQIRSVPRRLLLGVYRSEAFFTASAHGEKRQAGYDGYLKNHALLGDEFFMRLVSLTASNNLVPASPCAWVRHDHNANRKLIARNALEALDRRHGALETPRTAVQVIGRRDGRAGLFLSHWYMRVGILELVRNVFTRDQFDVDVAVCPKGIVFTIDPISRKPMGIITVLNNVLGNVLPESQHETLMAIRKIMS